MQNGSRDRSRGLHDVGWAVVALLALVPAPVRASVSIQPTSPLIGMEERVVLTAIVRDSTGAIVPAAGVSWSSSDVAVAGIASDGRVLPVTEGRAVFTAASGSESASVAIDIVWGVADADFSRRQTVRSMNGILLGLNGENRATPPDSLIAPIAPALWRGTDYIVAPERARGLGARYQVILAGYWGHPIGGWPNGRPWDNPAAYRAHMARVIDGLAGRVDVWEIWNEPDQNYGPAFWDGTELQFFETYLQTFRLLREKLGPSALIAGPSITIYDEAFLDRFAAFCIANGCEANVLTWHELGSSYPIERIAEKARRARARFVDDPAQSRLQVREIHVNETIGPPHTYSPAASLLYLKFLELGGVDAAARACWDDSTGSSDCYNNSLDGLLTPVGALPRSVWWAHRWYAQSVATRVEGTTARAQMLVFASRPNPLPDQPHTSKARIVTGFGGVDGAPARATLGLRVHGLAGVPDLDGASLVANVYAVLPSGEAAAPLPALVASVAVPVVAGTAHVALGSVVKDAVYEIVLTPGPVRAVEFYSAERDHYFISALPGDIAALDSGRLRGWTRTGKFFAVYPAAFGSASPVCRFYIPPAKGDSHFYSASPSECASVRTNYPTFVFESPAVMYVALPEAASGACASDETPVYRVWNGRAETNHRYTTDRAVRDSMVTQGWVAEGYGPAGVIMCAPQEVGM